MFFRLVLTILAMAAHPAHAAELPEVVTRQLPMGSDVIASESGRLDGGTRPDFIVALGRPDEAEIARATGSAPARPLLIFRPDARGGYRLAGRNDRVVFRLDEGGQCGPFMDGYEGIVVSGDRFTVQNGVACGQHWTDFITFRFDATWHEFVFQRRDGQSWKLNASTDPGAEVLVPDGAFTARADRRRPVAFGDYRP